MISPHTPPGTPLVVICTDKREILQTMIKPVHRMRVAKHWENALPPPFEVGQLVVLASIETNPLTVTGFVATIVGLPGRFALGCFRVATLPKCLTDILAGVPVLEDV